MSPTLLVLAAGMGSRYGGLKQLDPMGPAGETLLDYSVFDALRAGFGRIVFVIRRDFEADFRERIGKRYEKRADVDYVYQQLDRLPPGYSVPQERQKPWGTGHAIWCAQDKVKAPFAAINADDFYGAAAYHALAGFFQQMPAREQGPELFSMVGYRLGRTLSEHGTVARGVCTVDAEGYLEKVVECTGIEKTEDGARRMLPDETVETFSGDEAVSMNFWGFTPAVFPLLEAGLEEFLRNHSSDAKSEFYIPFAVAEMIDAAAARVRVLPTESSWFGVTYREDKPLVTESIARLVKAGDYPADLWSGAAQAHAVEAGK
ncbi:MAG: NTP transferase domain-containing protein [Chthoniobacteraceae bacterium]